MKKSVSKGNKSKVKIIVALVTLVIAVSAIGIGLGVGLSGGGDKKSQISILTLSELKAKLENLPNDSIVNETRISASYEWIDIDDDFFVNVIKKPIIKIPSKLEAQYEIANALNFDGDLTINLRIRKQGDTEWINLNPYIIAVTGITFSNLLSDLRAFKQKILERNSENGLLEIAESNLADVKETYFYSIHAIYPFYITSIKVLPLEREPVNKDGKATIKFEVTIDEDEKFIIPLEFKVGSDTWNVKEILENMSTDSIYKANGISFIDWKNLDDDFFNIIIEKEKPNLPDNIEVQYRISEAISNNGNLEVGNLVVDFRYRRKDITNDLWTTISSQYKLDIFLDKDLFDTQSALKDLSKDDISTTSEIEAITSWQQITNEVYNNILQVNPPSIPSNVKVQYKIPNAITEDGNLLVNFRYKKTNSSNWHTINHTVKIVGLSIAKAKAYINNLQKKDDSYYINSLDELLSNFSSSTILTKGNAIFIFDFPEGEEYQEPIENLLIYLVVEDNSSSSPATINLRFHFVYGDQEDNLFYTVFK